MIPRIQHVKKQHEEIHFHDQPITPSSSHNPWGTLVKTLEHVHFILQ